MIRNGFAKASFSLFFVLALVLTLAVPAFADGTAASSSGLDIRLKAGSGSMTVNGASVTVQPPFQKAGTTFVPLRVITKGFGASLQLKDNKIITLKYLTHTVTLTIGSKTAWADGKKVALVAAPVVVKGVTMVPLRVVEAFGGKVSYDAATKEVRITAATGAASSADSVNGIDADAGKTKIGDSFYEWSMNYPTGLVQSFQSPNGDALEFNDVAKNYFLGVYVNEASNPLSTTEVKDTIRGYFFDKETLMSSQRVQENGASYDKVLSKDASTGYLYEYRGIQANGRLYIIAFGKKAEQASDLTTAASILDSFAPSFDSGDSRLKDLTQVADGKVTFAYPNYGMTVKLPKDWVADEKSDTPLYYSANQDAYLRVNVSSVVPGDTLEAWVDRRIGRLTQEYDTPYIKLGDKTSLEWNGLPAVLLKVSFSDDTKSWSDEYEIFAVSGDHRYYAEFFYDQSQKNTYEAMAKDVLDSLVLDNKTIERNYGNVPDDTDVFDYSATVNKTSRKYGFSVDLPQHWTAVSRDFEGGDVTYSTFGTSFSISVIDQPADLAGAYQTVESIVQNHASSPDFKMLGSTYVTFKGKNAKRIEFEDSANGIPYRDIVYVLDNGGNLFIIEQNYDVSNGSAFNRKQLDDALQSFTFTS